MTDSTTTASAIDGSSANTSTSDIVRNIRSGAISAVEVLKRTRARILRR
jgi:hypothetical protein